jgi:hypothetical protein
LNYLICKRVTVAGIEIPNAQRDLHIHSGPFKVENVTKENQGTSCSPYSAPCHVERSETSQIIALANQCEDDQRFFAPLGMTSVTSSAA